MRRWRRRAGRWRHPTRAPSSPSPRSAPLAACASCLAPVGPCGARLFSCNACRRMPCALCRTMTLVLAHRHASPSSAAHDCRGALTVCPSVGTALPCLTAAALRARSEQNVIHAQGAGQGGFRCAAVHGATVQPPALVLLAERSHPPHVVLARLLRLRPDARGLSLAARCAGSSPRSWRRSCRWCSEWRPRMQREVQQQSCVFIC